MLVKAILEWDIEPKEDEDIVEVMKSIIDCEIWHHKISSEDFVFEVIKP